MLLRVKDIWHPNINNNETPWVYSNHKNFENNIEYFLGWVAMHNDWKIDGVEVINEEG